MTIRRYLTAAAALSLGLFATFEIAHAQRPARPPGQAWEYLVARLPETVDSRDEPQAYQALLNRQGAEGWELVTGGRYLYFKRPR